LERLAYRTDGWDKDLLNMQTFIKRAWPSCGNVWTAHLVEVWNDGAKHLAKQAGTLTPGVTPFQAM
jgi:hypothetical protein